MTKHPAIGFLEFFEAPQLKFSGGITRTIMLALFVRSDGVKILFLAANPVDVITRLRVDEEIRAIGRKIRLGPLRDQMELVSEWAVRAGDLQEVLLRHKPDVVHFSGHCSPSSGIILEDDAGNRKAVSKKALADLFRILKDNLRVVVLNACYAKDQAQALTSTIDFTIGMNDAIEDKAAIVFAAHFYQSLAYGRSVEEAFRLAVNQLSLEGLNVAHVPELLVRHGSSSEVRIGETASRVALTERPISLAVASGNQLAETSGWGLMRGLAVEEHEERKLRSIDLLPWFLAAIAISLITDVVRRFLESGWPDLAASIMQSVSVAFALAVAGLAIAAITLPRHPMVVKVAESNHLYAPQKTQPAVVLTSIALVIALGLWLSLPAFARYYNERGADFQYREQSDLSRAHESYQRAVRLAPGFAQAHYNLATVQEDLEPGRAVEEYLLAIRSDSRLYAAYNNLARLYLISGNDDDYESAIKLLNQAANLAPQDESVQYSLNKNLGWANYALKHYGMAETYLRKAIALRSGQGGAAAHCLLAYVLREQGKAGIVDECFDCVSLEPGERDVEKIWLSDARECLNRGGGK